MDIMIKVTHRVPRTPFRAEEQINIPKISRYLSAVVQRVSMPLAKAGNFSGLGGIQTLRFPSYALERKGPPRTLQVTTITESF